ncbi:DUF2442 domain-containing protein [uncultured Sphingomonas sp.]|uniref:DUF2442 domain-containing protein n=1 Tax=uncultured Sphingomonas sp. TaxID=158754 RepID=UPI0035CAA02D
MADLTDEDIEAASERGRIEFETKPHAARARYDRRTGMMTLVLHNGCSFMFPPRELQGMSGASDDDLEAFELSGVGFGLHWEALDTDFTVPGLLSGEFGTNRFMATRRARLRSIYEQLVQSASGTDQDVQAAE